MSPQDAIVAIGFLQGALAVGGALLLFWLVGLALPGFVRGAPYVSSGKEKVRAMVRLAALRPGETVVDLGSGDGRLLVAAAGDGRRLVGYEINLPLVWYARCRLLARGASRTGRIVWGDLWRADLRAADVIFIYPFGPMLERMSEKLRRELRPGARVVSLRYRLPHMEPAREEEGAYLYVFGSSGKEGP